MAGKIKGITIEIGGDTQKLNKALEDVNKKTRDVQSELRQVERLLKLDPKNTELLAQKQKLLADAVENSREKLDRLKTAQEQVNEQFRKGEINEEQYRAFQREVVKAEQELEKFEKQLRETGLTAEQVGQKLKDAGQKMTDVGKNLTMKVTAPVLAIGAAATKLGMDFEAAMSEVGAISGATGDDLAALEAKAKEMGATTKFSASEAAEGLKYMAMAGWDVQQQLDGLPGVLNLAAAAGEALGTVSDIVTDAMTAFGLEAAQAGEFADVLAAASSSANTNVGMMGETFKYVAPLFGSLGYTVEDASLAVGLMANAGIKGSQSGTVLRGAISRLVKPTGDAAKRIAELGIQITDVEGNMLPFRNVMDQLRVKFANLTAEQQAQYAATIFGQEAMSGMLAIISASEADYNKLSSAIDNSTGAAQRMADEMQDNLQGRLTELKSAIEGVALQLYDHLQPALEKIVEVVQKLVAWFANLSPGVQQTIIIIAGLAAAIGPLLVVLGAMASSLSAIIGILPVLGAALTALTGPIGIAIAAIAGLVAAGIALYKNWDIVKYYGLQAWGNLKIGVLKAIDAIAAAYEKLLGWIPSLGSEIRNVHAQIRRMIEQEQVTLESRIKPGTSTSMADFRQLDEQSQKTSDSLKGLQSDLDDIAPSFDSLGSAASGAGGKMSAAAEKSKTVWTGTADAIKTALSTLQTMHETEMVRAEMAGDNVEILRLKYRQLSEELEGQKAVVAATRAELEKATAAGVQEGETAEDLAKRIDGLNKKLADEERAQAQLEKQVHDTREAMKTQAQDAKKLAVELKTVAETYYSDLAKALEEYQTKVKETNENLLRETEKLKQELESKLDEIRARGIERERQVTEQFQRELENRTRALINFVGLFDEVTRREVSGETLLKNLQDQVRVFEGWQENIAELAARGLDAGLLQELREMGPKAAPEIAALLTLTDAQLQEYASLWRQKQEQAREEATAQLAQQREEMNRQLYEIRRDTANQLEQQRREVAQKLQDMQAKAKEELEKYKKEWEKKNEEIRKNTEKNIQDIHKRFQDLVGRSTNYGIALMDNFMAGIDSQMPALIARMESIAGMIDSYMPHSPAKRGPLSRIMEWGPALVDSLVDGIRRSLPKLESIMENMANIPTARAVPIAGGSSTTYNYNTGGNTIHITVQDGEDLLRTLHRLGVRIS